MSEAIRMIVADDHPIVRKGLRQVIEEESNFEIAGEAGDGETALLLIQTLRPRVAILDLDMPKMSGFAAAAEVRKLELATEIIFLTMHSEVDLLHRAIDLGGKGFVVKESALVEIVSAIGSVAAGFSYVSPSMTAALVDRRARGRAFEQSKPALSDLTPSERRILGMIAHGKATKEIAAELHIHPRTVETHRASICQKLQLSGANSLLRFGLEHKSDLVI